MRLVSFRIKNYKSILDSGICLVDERVTILAGKNEAGKTAILQALEDFNEGREIRREAKPIGDESLNPEIALTFEFAIEDLNEILGSLEIPEEASKQRTDRISQNGTGGLSPVYNIPQILSFYSF